MKEIERGEKETHEEEEKRKGRIKLRRKKKKMEKNLEAFRTGRRDCRHGRRGEEEEGEESLKTKRKMLNKSLRS